MCNATLYSRLHCGICKLNSKDTIEFPEPFHNKCSPSMDITCYFEELYPNLKKKTNREAKNCLKRGEKRNSSKEQVS